MRICFVAAALPGTHCGVGDYTDRLATALAETGHEPIVVTTARPELAPATYEVRPVATRWRAADTAAIAHAVLTAKPDLVHVQFPGVGYGRAFGVTALPWAILAARPRLPVALTLHEFEVLSRRHRLRLAAGAVPCRLVIGVAPGIERSCRRYLGWRPWSRVDRIPLASNLIPSAAGAIAPRRFHRAHGELVVGYWGFIRPDKGLDDLLESFRRVRSEQAARLVVAGDPGPDLHHVRDFRDAVERSGLVGDVVFTGPLDPVDLSATLLGFDVCVLPFRDGLTTNRGSYAAAVAHGLPVVTTSRDRSGLDEPSNTWFARPGDVAGLAEAITRHGSSPHREPAGGTRAEWASIAERHLALYRRLVSA